jgi:hypothetical protein
MVTIPNPVTADVEQIRRDQNVSILALSTASGVPRSSLKRKLANPGTFTIDEYLSICDALGIPAPVMVAA